MTRHSQPTKAAPRIDVRKYRGQWVALHPKTYKVVGHGRTLRAAERCAAAKKVTKPLMLAVPKSDAFLLT